MSTELTSWRRASSPTRPRNPFAAQSQALGRQPKPVIPTRQLAVLLFVIAAGFMASALAAPDLNGRPEGANCHWTQPPPESGEEAGHGVVLQAFPRIKNLGKSYSGCQAVFVTTRDRPATLAWLLELKQGDPVRIWSTDDTMRPYLACRMRQGKLIAGDPALCQIRPIQLLPTIPAGCVMATAFLGPCEYDGN